MPMHDEKRPLNLLVTGVGAIIGYGIIKSIRMSGIPSRVVGMDIYPDAVGQHWCDAFITAKYAVDPDYLSFLREVMRRHRIDLAFFGTEQEIYRISRDREEMGADIEKLVLGRAENLDLSRDKWLTRAFLIQNGMGDLAIPSAIEGGYAEIAARFGEAFLLKPRCSYASKGIVRVSDPEAFAFYKKRMGDNFMAQRLIGDIEHEYTVSVFGLGDGTCSASIALKRKLSQEGATAKAEVVSDALLQESVDRLCRAFRPVGPTNLQFRFENGRYYLLEINPRISSATSIRAAFGYNEAEMCIRYFLSGEVVAPVLKAGRAVRFIDEVVLCHDGGGEAL